MNLPGLSNGPPPRPSGNEGKPPAPDAAGRTHTFGDVVSDKLPQPLKQDGEGGAAAGIILPTDQSSRQFPAEIVKTANESTADLDQGLNPGAQPALAAEQIADLAPDSDLPGEDSILPPEAPDDSISDRGDVSPLGEMLTAIKIPVVGTPARPGAEQRATVVVSPGSDAGGPPASLPNSSENADRGRDFGAIQSLRGAPAVPVLPGQGSPSANSDAANPLPRGSGEAVIIDPGNTVIKTPPVNTATPASPDAAGGVPDQNPVAAPALEPTSKSQNMAGTVQTRAGEHALARGVNLPDLEARTGERGARRAPEATLTPEALPPGDRATEPGARPAPNFPELPTVAARGRGSIVHDAVMQAHGALEQVGLAASAAATAQSPTGSTQPPTPALQANAGGAELARAVAPQIAMAIGSGTRSGQIELRLDPPELGKVTISLEITDQSLRAIVMADRPATNELLRRHGDVLLTQLQQAGFTGIDLQFAGNRAGNHGTAQHGDTPRPAFTGDLSAISTDETVDVPAGRAVQRTLDGLDLRF